MSGRNNIVIVTIATMCAVQLASAEVEVVQNWSEPIECILGARMFATMSSYYSADHYDCGMRSYIGSYITQGDFYLAWIKNLSEGDVVQFYGRGCNSAYGARFSEFWSYTADQIVHENPCPLYGFVFGSQVDARTYVVPEGACGIVICATNTANAPYNILGEIRLVVPDHAEVVLPGRTVGPEMMDLTIADVPHDQGGFVAASWNKHDLDDAQATFPVVAYDIQRLDEEWVTIESVEAVGTDLYSAVVATPDVVVVGNPAPISSYRVLARKANPAIFYPSLVSDGYSVDNLSPAAPALSLSDTETSRTLVWFNDAAPDLAETCLYRDFMPGFEAGDPVVCSSNQFWYLETHLARYYYRARSFDIHGNASEWSNEVIGRWPTPVPQAVPIVLRLYPCQPNPFNPRTTIKYDLPESGPVRLAVFDLAGRLIRTLVDEGMPQGSHEAVWDGRDATGREVSSGTYLARLEFGGEVEVVRMGLVR